MFQRSKNPSISGKPRRKNERTLLSKVCPADSGCTRFFSLTSWRFGFCRPFLSPRSTQESRERPAENEGYQDSRWQHRIRLLGNLVFGTDLRLSKDFLKSCVPLSEKHGAHTSADSAGRPVSPTSAIFAALSPASCFAVNTCGNRGVSAWAGILAESFR